MKIGGVEITPCEEVLVLPRPEQDIVIRAKAVESMDLFEKLCPEPVAPGIRTKDGHRLDTEDEGYLAQLSAHSEQRMNFMVIHSLEPSEVEWDEVDLEVPRTWPKWSDELKAAGLSDIECGRIIRCVLQANSLDEAKVKAARADFLRGLAQ